MSTMISCQDIPFWSETLDIYIYFFLLMIFLVFIIFKMFYSVSIPIFSFSGQFFRLFYFDFIQFARLHCKTA